jgi:16S rRNA (guanine527-N7)-methyltransferase
MSPDQTAKLKAYLALLLKWQKAVNLVSPSTLPDAWERHFLDSVQVEQYLPQGPHVLADLGSGAGFPGLALAMLRPDLDVHLVESDDKKCQFMKTVSRETSSPVSVHTVRIEDSYALVSPDVITARALAALDKLLTLCWPWAQANPALTMIFLKGEKAEEELEEARKTFEFSCETFPSATDGKARLLRISSLQKRI